MHCLLFAGLQPGKTLWWKNKREETDVKYIDTKYSAVSHYLPRSIWEMPHEKPACFVPAEELKQSVIENALKAYGHGCAAEDVVALMDTTLLHSGEDGYLLSKDALYGKGWETPAPLHGLCGAALCSEKPGCLQLNYQDGSALERYAPSYASYLCDVLNALVKYEGVEKLELTPRNVYRIMKECQKTDATKHVIKSNFYSSTAGRKAPILEFDEEKLDEYENTIRYMAGQLMAVHRRKATMIPSYGAMDYKGRDWTNNDNMALFTLYYLATASLVLPSFEKGINDGVASPIGKSIKLRPTFWPPLPE